MNRKLPQPALPIAGNPPIEPKAPIVTTTRQRAVLIRMMAVVAIAFGLLTIKEGGTVLFVDGAARAAAGNYVPFVLWFNFVAGFGYVIAGIGLWMRWRWAVRLAAAIAVATAYTFVVFVVHIYYGGAYEPRTVIAMGLRTIVWTTIAASAWYQTTVHSAAKGAS